MSIRNFLRRTVAFSIHPTSAWQEILSSPHHAWRQVVLHALLLGAVGPLSLGLGLAVFGTPPALASRNTPMAADSPMALAVVQSFGAPLPFSAPVRRIDIESALATAGLTYLSVLSALAGLAFLYWALAPACDGRRTPLGATQVAAFGMTPACLGAIGLCHPYFYLLPAIGLLHSAVVTHAGARIVLQTPGTEAAVLIGLTVMLFQIGAPLAAFLFSAAF